jgi:catechol 2,3-dioxygenase-like lactoylglutathione lyase family enzyme
MLSEGKVFATIAVNDIDQGKAFYGGTLGLKQVNEDLAGVTYESGGGQLLVYVSSTAGSGQATCASWEVADIEAVVDDLKSKGITFEQYDMPGVTWENEIATAGPTKAAWFKDPDGNILAVGTTSS